MRRYDKSFQVFERVSMTGLDRVRSLETDYQCIVCTHMNKLIEGKKEERNVVDASYIMCSDRAD